MRPRPLLHLLQTTANVHVTSKQPSLCTIPGVFDPALASASHLLFAHLRSSPACAAFPPTASHLVAHRLDFATSGLLLLAASSAGAAALGLAFRSATISKRYEALLDTRLAPRTSPLHTADCGEVALPLGKRAGTPLLHTAALHSGGGRTVLREARTRWIVLARAPGRVRVALQPLTGRTHQLRLHCAVGLGAPILGDHLYGLGGEYARELAARTPAAARSAELQLYIDEALELQQRAAAAAAPEPAPPSRLHLHAQQVTLPEGAFCGSGVRDVAGSLERLCGAAAEGGLLSDCRASFSRHAPCATASAAAYTVQHCAESHSVTLALATPF